MKYQETGCIQPSVHMALVKQFYNNDKDKIYFLSEQEIVKSVLLR
jgi:hypothetical protein